MVVFYTYGRHQLRLKACLTLFFAVRFGSLIILEALLAQGLPIAEGGFVILLPAFLATLLIPAAQRAIRSMEARRVYAEEQQGPNIPLPSERSDVLSACDDLIQALPEGVVLDDDERTALCYLIDGQDADVTAYFMKTSTRRVRELNANVFAKFGVKSSHELIMELGAMRTRAGRENREALFERYNLTAREREIVTLLLSGEAMKNIAGTLGISQSTVNFHSTNLYRKLNVQSRVQLMERFLSEENTR
jgi:DNA-binding CsgD family transcriptional regulator